MSRVPPLLPAHERRSSHERAERWLLPVTERGISQVATLREDDHCFKDLDGMLFVAGHAHCLMTRQQLGVIRPRPPNAPSP